MVASTVERVPRHTSVESNERIREETERNVAYYSRQGRKAIDRRLEDLDKEWDIERMLEANAASATLVGVFMGMFWNRKWFVLPGIVGGFLLQHAIDGWCPPLPVLRRLGFRTPHEIEHERHALLQGAMRKIGIELPSTDADNRTFRNGCSTCGISQVPQRLPASTGSFRRSFRFR